MASGIKNVYEIDGCFIVADNATNAFECWVEDQLEIDEPDEGDEEWVEFSIRKLTLKEIAERTAYCCFVEEMCPRCESSDGPIFITFKQSMDE